MTQPSIAHVAREFIAFLELLDDAYWEVSRIQDKDFLYNIISCFHQELGEINKLSIQDHHYPYEMISESIRRIQPQLLQLERDKERLLQRSQTQTDMKELLSNILIIIDSLESAGAGP